MPDQIQDFATTGREWILTQSALFVTIAAILALIQPSVLLARFVWRQLTTRARLEFGRVCDDDDESIRVRIVNTGNGVARNITFAWTPQCECSLEKIAQPALLLPGESLVLTFRIETLELLSRSIFVADWQQMGSLEVVYRGMARRKVRTGFSLVAPSSEYDASALVNGAALEPLPRRQWAEWWFIRWIVGRFRDPQREADKADREAQRQYLEWLISSKNLLAEHGIMDSTDENATELLAHQMQIRGWSWSYEPGGRGYIIRAERLVEPSYHSTIRFSGRTPEESFTLSLAAAIQEDLELGR